MSYVEMLVALSLVTLVLLIALGLLVEMGRHVEKQGLRAPSVGGPTDLALDRLEKDLRDARSMSVHGGGRGSEMTLRARDGATIGWRLEGTALLRRHAPPSGEAVERIVADAVALVEWQRRSAHLADVRIRRRDETLRQRTVLLRNLERAGRPPEAP